MVWYKTFFTGAGAITKVGAVGVFKFIVKHAYIFILILVLLPKIFGAVAVSIETNNPTYPFVVVALSVTNADQLIDDDTNLLREDPSGLLGNKGEGIWEGIKHNWRIFKVAFGFLGNIFLISIPFVILYRIISTRQTSEPARNWFWTIIIGLIVILFVNMTIVVVSAYNGTLTGSLPEGDFFAQSLFLFKSLAPFHGVYNLGDYLININA